MPTDAPGGTARRTGLTLRLFVVEGAPNSMEAVRNLELFIERLAQDGVEVDLRVVDVRDDPSLALECGVYLTPALQVLGPGRPGMVFGNLRDIGRLSALLEGSL